MDPPVDPPGECAFERAPNVAVGFALCCSLGLIFTGFCVAAEPGNSDDMQCPVEVSIPATVESVPGSLTAACFERGNTGERGECRFAANTTTVRPADQQLCSDDRADPRFG